MFKLHANVNEWSIFLFNYPPINETDQIDQIDEINEIDEKTQGTLKLL